MQINNRSDNGFIISNNHYKIECDLIDNNVIICKDSELEHYCKLVFPYSWDVSNLVQILDIGSNETLFEVDLIGNDFNEWVNQLLKAFADFVNDDMIIGYYNINGFKIVKVL